MPHVVSHYPPTRRLSDCQEDVHLTSLMVSAATIQASYVFIKKDTIQRLTIKEDLKPSSRLHLLSSPLNVERSAMLTVIIAALGSWTTSEMRVIDD